MASEPQHYKRLLIASGLGLQVNYDARHEFRLPFKPDHFAMVVKKSGATPPTGFSSAFTAYRAASDDDAAPFSEVGDGLSGLDGVAVDDTSFAVAKTVGEAAATGLALRNEIRVVLSATTWEDGVDWELWLFGVED